MSRRSWLKLIALAGSSVTAIAQAIIRYLPLLYNWRQFCKNFVLNRDDPAWVVTKFLEAWHKGDAETMYSLLDTKTRERIPLDRLQYGLSHTILYKPTVLWVHVAYRDQKRAIVDFAVSLHFGNSKQILKIFDTTKKKRYGFGIFDIPKEEGRWPFFSLDLCRYELIKETDGWRIVNAISEFIAVYE